MFTTTVSSLKVWQYLLLSAAVVVVVLVVSKMVTVKNIVSSNEGTFIKTSFLRPFNKDRANEIAKAHEESVAAKVAAATTAKA